MLALAFTHWVRDEEVQSARQSSQMCCRACVCAHMSTVVDGGKPSIFPRLCTTLYEWKPQERNVDSLTSVSELTVSD